MPSATGFLLDVYYHATAPVRGVLLAHGRRCGTAPLCILFYHRVADSHPNPWTISNAGFREQMGWLKSHVELISLAELQRRMRERDSHRLAVHVTFDDGYAENCDQAIPFLLREQIPCTYFVAWDFVAHQRPFPHDVGGDYLAPPNRISELRDMASAGIEIGVHTRTHADFQHVVEPDRIRDEVVQVRDEMAREFSTPLRYFAIPYGQREQIRPEIVRLAREAGYEGVCQAFGGYNFPGQDAFLLRRIHGDPVFSRFRNWLTGDPRMMFPGGLFPS